MSDVSVSILHPSVIEVDLARSAWHDPVFAVWFSKFAKAEILFNGPRGEHFFRDCGEFARQHKAAAATAGDAPEQILTSAGAVEWFRSMSFLPLPGGRSHKPTSWQIEKARKYLSSRHNELLAEKLAEAEEIRANGDAARADRLAFLARQQFGSFSDSIVPCNKALSDIDALVGLAESTPPLFRLSGEMGRLLNHRLKPDNLGVILGDPKIGKTTDLVTLAIEASRYSPTLLIGTGDESELKYNARIITNLSGGVTQPEFAGRYGMPIPDCAHNAAGTCPLKLGGEPRQTKDWRVLIENGATPLELADGTFEGSATISGAQYQPCTRCYPQNDGTAEDRERRRHWKSAVWWRPHEFSLLSRDAILATRLQFEATHAELRVAAYPSDTLTVDGIVELLETLDRTEGFVPRVIVLDYADLMKQEHGRDTDKDHDGLRRIWQQLRALTTKYKILLITATQTNRAGDGIKTHTRRTIGRSSKSADNCTWFLTLNQTAQERRACVMRASMLYGREGKYDPEHQALCCQWHEIQDGFPFSMPIFCKLESVEGVRE